MGRKANNATMEPEAWERAKRMAFWDQGKMTYPQWVSSIEKNDSRTIRQSIGYMRAVDFISLVGKKKFEQYWPEWRKLQPPSNSPKVAILDAAWGLYVAGDVSFPATARMESFHNHKVSRMGRATFRAIARSNGTNSIYQLAKEMGRNYRRVYDDIQNFAKAGVVELLEERRDGRVAKIAKMRRGHSYI